MSDLLLVSAPLARRELPGGVCPSLSTITLGSYLRAQGCAVEVFDPSVELPDDVLDAPDRLLDHVAEAVRARAPRVVGVTCLSGHEGRFGIALARRLRRADGPPVVLGGIWASAAAADILERYPEVSGVVCGPGELPAVALCRGGLDRPGEVPGLAWRAHGRVHFNPPAETPFDSPPLDLSLLARPDAYDIFCWLSSRGCPYHCAFCTEHVGSPTFGLYANAKVEADLRSLAEVGPDWYLWLCDPLFGVPHHRVDWLCDRLAAAPQQFLAESRVDVLRPADVPAMKAAGCEMIYFGLEAVTAPALRALGKIGHSPTQHARYLAGAEALIEACLRHDVLPVMGVLQPAPGDQPSDLARALDWLEDIARLPARLGTSLAPCFHAFPIRLDRGSRYAAEQDRLAADGATFSEVPDPLFDDRFLVDASGAVDAEEAERFRAAVRGLNSDDPQVRARLLRSFPRPYVHFALDAAA